jgi:hypothetical protein
MVGLLGITLAKFEFNCNQKGARPRNMNLQASTKFDCAIERNNFNFFSECTNGHRRQNGEANEPLA